MKKIHQNLLISFITIFFLIEFLTNSSSLINVFFDTINLCFYNILPNIFVFFLITDVLNNYNFPYYLSRLFGNIIEKIYHLPKSCTYIILMSLSSGFPSNAKLIKDALDNKSITSFDATRLLTMTHFSNPLFIIYTVGINFFHDEKVGYLILGCHFITNFFIGFIFRNIYQYEKNDNEIKFTKSLPFITLLKTSFMKTAKMLINIFSIIIFFAIISTTISKYLNLNSFSNTILSGILEITSGLKLLSKLNISKLKAAMIATFFISFGGFSIHMQEISLLSKYKINYFIYLIARLIHASISALLIAIIM